MHTGGSAKASCCITARTRIARHQATEQHIFSTQTVTIESITKGRLAELNRCVDIKKQSLHCVLKISLRLTAYWHTIPRSVELGRLNHS